MEDLTKSGKEKELTAKHVMKRGVMGVDKNELVGKVTRIMRKHIISQLPVFDKGVIIGHISEKTIVERIVTKGENPAELSGKAVGEIMEDPFPSINKETPLSVISPLLEHSPAVVVMDKGLAVGIITKADLLKFVKG